MTSASPSNTTRPLRTPLVTSIVDIHAGDHGYNLEFAVAKGLLALWHKNSEGVTFTDKRFVQAMDRAKAMGLLRGAYHFAKGTSNAEAQAEVLVDDVNALCDDTRDEILLALDLEGEPSSPTVMSTDDAARFVVRVFELTNRWPVLYLGLSKGNERMRKASAEVRAILGHCPLWLAAYGPNPLSLQLSPPAPWASWSLQQYTNGSAGPRDQVTFPRTTPGFERVRQDRSVFRGSADELKTWWLNCGR